MMFIILPTMKRTLLTDDSADTSLLSHCKGSRFSPDGCIVLICTAGHAIVSINFMRHKFRRGDVAVIMSDQSFMPIDVSEDCQIQYVSLSEATVEQALYKITSTTFWDFICCYPIVTPEARFFSMITDWYRQMYWICSLDKNDGNRHTMLSNSFYNFFLAYDSIISDAENVKDFYKKDRAWILCGKFASLIVKHCRETREARFYAEKLLITPDYLYKITNKIMGQTPKQLIDLQVLTEMKTYLSDTDMTLKDIAGTLGFEDPSYMCRFFRRMTGMSPRQFQQSVQ